MRVKGEPSEHERQAPRGQVEEHGITIITVHSLISGPAGVFNAQESCRAAGAACMHPPCMRHRTGWQTQIRSGTINTAASHDSMKRCNVSVRPAGDSGDNEPKEKRNAPALPEAHASPLSPAGPHRPHQAQQFAQYRTELQTLQAPALNEATALSTACTRLAYTRLACTRLACTRLACTRLP